MSIRSAIVLTTAMSLLALANAAGAAPYGSFDPRSLGMGGAGVASGASANAVFLNPALLANANGRDRFGIALPMGGKLSDPDDMVDAIDAFADDNPIDAFQGAIENYENTSDAAAVASSGQALIGHFEALSNKALQAEGLAALVVAVPGDRFGASAFVNGYVIGGTIGVVSDADIAAIEAVIASANNSQVVIDPSTGFTSSVEARFASVIETGVSLATRVDLLGGFSVGVTPKYVQVRTYDYRFVGNELDSVEIDLENGERVDSNFNFDVGVAKEWGDRWVTGLSVRNMLSQEYRTVQDNVLKIEPHPRVGIARRGELMTIAADLDLRESEPAGFESKSRYAILGAEIDLFRTVQFRAGYRHNLSSRSGEEAGMYSAGLGLSPFGVHVDAAVAGNSDEIGGALQLGFRF